MPDVKAVRSLLRERATRPSPILTSIELCHFRGAQILVAEEDGPVGVLAIYLGKRPKGDFGPWANMYVNYVPEPFRRRGISHALYAHAIGLAREAGCTRLKSLASSTDGALFQLSVAHFFWGLAPSNELITDTPLLDANIARPPGALTRKPMTDLQVRRATRNGLRYDP